MNRVYWIDATKVQPQNARAVLVYLPNVLSGTMSIGYWVESQGHWQEDPTGNYWNDGAVSHWAELPEKP